MQQVLKKRRKKRSKRSSEFLVEERVVEQAAHPTKTDEFGLPVNSTRVLRSRLALVEAADAEQAKQMVTLQPFPRWSEWRDGEGRHNKRFRQRCQMVEVVIK